MPTSDRVDDVQEEEIGICSRIFQSNIFSVMSAQMFEYNIAHIIDKPIESFFGFIHVISQPV